MSGKTPKLWRRGRGGGQRTSPCRRYRTSVYAGVSFLAARTHAGAREDARVYVAHAYIEDRIKPSREAKSGERMKPASQPATANHQPRLERSGRPTVDSLESWPRTRTADYVTVRRTTKALLRAPLGRHSYSILDQDGERSTDGVRGRGFSLSLGKMRSNTKRVENSRSHPRTLRLFVRVRSINGL